MRTETPLLSVVIISHNQCDVLGRCIDSVLAQRTSFPVQIIVSDDRSTDGTREMIESKYKDKVIYSYCNSDDCKPYYVWERAGYNRINGLRLAKGKYLIHIDGDDFFTSEDIFQRQVDVLEEHPECSMCVQNYRIVDADCQNPEIGCKTKIFEGNPIISASEFVTQVGYVPNATCCMRKKNLETSLHVPLQGKNYDDIDITFRYIGFGKIALINRHDFNYVQSPNSICHTQATIEWNIVSMSFFQAMTLAPHLSIPLIQTHYRGIWYLAKLAWKKPIVPEKLISYFEDVPVFIYRVFDNKYAIKNRLRLFVLILWLIPIRYLKIKNDLSWKVLYRLSIPM